MDVKKSILKLMRILKMKNKILVILLSLSSVACSSKGIDGDYKRVDQTEFEKSQGMSSDLVISNEGSKVIIKNAWGDVDLKAIKKNDQLVIQENNQDAFVMKKNKDIVILTDVDNPSQIYKFQEK